MKIIATFNNIVMELEAQSVLEAVELVADLQAIMNPEPCGLCGSPSALDYRAPQGFKYYERVCTNCGAVLRFGKTRDAGRLFPKRTDENGVMIGKNGWHKYVGKARPTEDSTTAAPAQDVPSQDASSLTTFALTYISRAQLNELIAQHGKNQVATMLRALKAERDEGKPVTANDLLTYFDVEDLLAEDEASPFEQ